MIPMKENPKKHLLVIRLSALGDVAMTVPVLRTLLDQHPDLSVTLLTRKFFAPMFDEIPRLSVYEADVKGKHKGMKGLYKLSKELQALQIHAVADLHNVLRSKILKLFFRAGGLKVVQIDKGRAEKKALTREKNKVFEPLKTTHERYADVFRKLGYDLHLSDHVFPAKKQRTPKIMEVIGTDTNKWVGVAPFAAFQGKMYPFDLMEKVIEKLSVRGDCKIILFGGGNQEREILESLEPKYANVISVVGKLSFEEELSLISNLDVMVSMDSGNAHLAAMYGVQTITLWGVTHPFAGFYPFGQPEENALLSDREQYPLIPTSVYGNKVPRGYEDVMRSVKPAQVVQKIKDALK